MSPIIAHMIGSVTYFIGIALLSNTVKQVYINELLFQHGIIAKGRIISKPKKPLLCVTSIKRHYLTIEYVIYSAQSLICNIKIQVSKQFYNQLTINDFITIIYTKQDNKFYHNIKSRMDQQSKPVSLYSQIAISIMMLSIYPFIYFISGHFMLIPSTILVVLCVISAPHHFLLCDTNKGHSIQRLANCRDLKEFGIECVVETDTSSENEREPDVMASSDSNEFQTTSSTSANININSVNNSQSQMDSNKCVDEIIDRPQEAIAILYESYVETPSVEDCGGNKEKYDDEDGRQDEYVMVFN